MKFTGQKRKRNPKYKVGDYVRTADRGSNFCKNDSTNWSYKLYPITEVIDDTIPSYHIEYLPERYNVALLKKSKLTLDKNESVIKKIETLFQIKLIKRMKNLDKNFYTEVDVAKYIINDGKILRETSPPVSIKSKYETVNGVKVELNKKYFRIRLLSLRIVDLNEKKNEITDEEEFIMRHATLCRRCITNALLAYVYEFTCYIRGIIVVKTKKNYQKIEEIQISNLEEV